MKKICIMVLVLTVAFTLFGCRRKAEPTPTESTTRPTQAATTPSTVETDPILETNIPDPNVESNSNPSENIIDKNHTATDSTDGTETTGTDLERSRIRMFR